MKKRHLHLAFDNPSQDFFLKFLCEERSAGNHEILIFSESLKLKYVNYSHHRNIKVIKSNHEEYLNSIDTTLYSQIFIHYLNSLFANFVINNKNKTKFSWIFWGADGFDLNILESLHDMKTEQLISSKQHTSKNIKYQNNLRIVEVLRFFKLWKLFCLVTKKNTYFTPDEIKKEALKYIDFCLANIEADYNLLMNKYPFLNLIWKPFFYMPLIEKEEAIYSSQSKGTVLLGNSSNPTNNHIELIDYLKDVNPKIKKVICPLSYSGHEWYKEKVKSYSSKVFQNKIEFITDFLPKNDWQLIMKNVDVVFFNHYRSQAIGNIMSSLVEGQRIYLNSKSTVYNKLKKMGCFIFAIDRDEIVINPLSKEEASKNKKLIEAKYSKVEFEKNWNNICLY